MRDIFWAGALALALVGLAPGVAIGAPIYVTGNTCPSELNAVLGDTHQFKVDDATNCIFDRDSNNIQGTQAEADALLNGAFGTGWVGLGETGTDGTGISGLIISCLSGDCDDAPSGSFTASVPYAQIAFGLKDGAFPHWGIFVMPTGDFGSNWSIFPQGGFSHATLYGRTGGSVVQQVVPEPASLVLLGLGLLAVSYRVRRKRRLPTT